MTDLVAGRVVEVAPGVSRVLAPNPSLMTGPGTNTYLVGSGDLAVIDPGPADDAHLDAVAAAAAGLLRYVLVTHTHPDHAPGAAGLAERSGATILGFGARDGFEPDGTLSDGDVVAGDGFRLRAVHTPGHASNHLCYLLEGPSILFSGDHVMGGSTVVIAPPDGDMAEYLDSLARVRDLEPALTSIAPGHGPMLHDARAVLEEYVAHRLGREATITAALLLRGQATVDEIVADVYLDVAAELHPVARYSVWAHLRKLAAEGRAFSPGADRVDSRWEAL